MGAGLLPGIPGAGRASAFPTKLPRGGAAGLEGSADARDDGTSDDAPDADDALGHVLQGLTVPLMALGTGLIQVGISSRRLLDKSFPVRFYQMVSDDGAS